MAKNFKYQVNLLNYHPEEMLFGGATVFPYGYQEVEFRTLNEGDKCVFCGEPQMRERCTCPDYQRVLKYVRQRYADSKITISRSEIFQVSASSNYCHCRPVEFDPHQVATPMTVKVEDFDFCTRIDDNKKEGMIMLSRAWHQLDQICFFARREGRPRIHLVVVDRSDIDLHYPVYHVEWITNRSRYKMDIEKVITPDIIIQNLSAVRLPV